MTFSARLLALRSLHDFIDFGVDEGPGALILDKNTGSGDCNGVYMELNTYFFLPVAILSENV